jgi:hypothetical protein
VAFLCLDEDQYQNRKQNEHNRDDIGSANEFLVLERSELDGHDTQNYFTHYPNTDLYPLVVAWNDQDERHQSIEHQVDFTESNRLALARKYFTQVLLDDLVSVEAPLLTQS